jgi:hypoxanthine phosphoribosyltransferase
MQVEQDIEEILFTKEEIAKEVSSLAKRIGEDYADSNLLIVVILSGAVVFACDLMRELNIDVELDFMAVSSYGSRAESSGVVRIVKDISRDIEGRNVLVVEDVLDTGLTLNYLLKNLKSRKPKTLELAVLFEKKRELVSPVKPKYLGLPCPDKFLVGYGLDYAEKYRNLPYLGILKEEVYSG